jgi:hypothetical protein
LSEEALPGLEGKDYVVARCAAIYGREERRLEVPLLLEVVAVKEGRKEKRGGRL